MRTLLTAALLASALAPGCSRDPAGAGAVTASERAARSAAEAGSQLSRSSTRALWITRWDYRTRADVARAIRDADEAGFDAVLFQVRGCASAFWPSAIEPWAEELGGSDPGFDPLALALSEAKARGIELHAWVNIVPAWWGKTPPANPAHVWNAHPEWLWYDQAGAQQPLVDRFYVSLNPCLPEVRAYVVSVLREIAERYDVAGLHLDYARFPNEAPVIPEGSGLDYPRDARSLELFRAATGATPEGDPAAWDAWRADCVTELVRSIRGMLHEARPGAVLSAAVGPVPAVALAHHFQDSGRWLSEGLVDAVYPMNYAKSAAQFEQRVAAWVPWMERGRVVMGMRLDLAEAAEHEEQARAALAMCDGFAVFAYSLLFESPNDVLNQVDAEFVRKRDERRALWLPKLRAWAAEAKRGAGPRPPAGTR